MVVRYLIEVAALTLLVSACGPSSSPVPPEAQGSGVVNLDPSRSTLFYGVTVDHAGNVLGTGFFNTADQSHTYLQVARILRTGGLDKEFGDGGSVDVLPIGRDHGAGFFVIEDAEQRIVVCGSWWTPDPSGAFGTLEAAAALVRLLPNGQLDSSFGTNGIAALPPGLFGTSTSCHGVRESGGFYYITASNFPEASPITALNLLCPNPLAGQPLGALNQNSSFLTRFDQQGSWDPTFGQLGAVQFPDGYLAVARLGSDNAGRLYVARLQNQSCTFGPSVYLDRFLPDGTRDTSFGTDGEINVALADSTRSAVVDGLAVGPTGDVWIAGLWFSTRFDPALWHVRPNGVVDMAFTETVSAALASDAERYFVGVTTAADGQPVLVLFDQDRGTESVLKIGSSGTPDTAFGDQGYATPLIWPLAITANQEDVVVGGYTMIPTSGQTKADASAVEFIPR